MPLLASERAPTYGVCYGVAILLADSFYSSVAVLHADYQRGTARYHLTTVISYRRDGDLPTVVLYCGDGGQDKVDVHVQKLMASSWISHLKKHMMSFWVWHSTDELLGYQCA